MTDQPRPILSRRRLRLILQQPRCERGCSTDDIRVAMDWSLSKAHRIAAGDVSISTSDLRALLAFFEVTDREQVQSMLGLARRARQHHWAAQNCPAVSPSHMDLLGYEDDAQRISQNHPYLVPSLLQTADYARDVVAADPHHRADPQAAEARVRLRKVSTFSGRLVQGFVE